jgi:RNA polymerase sigma factor (sigma-70 family)
VATNPTTTIYRFAMDEAKPTSLPVAPASGSFAFADTGHLTARLRAGDEEAFAWLHREWSGRLNRYCFALAAGDEAFAHEIAQAVWLRLVKHGRRMESEQALWNWLACAARHAAVDLRRKGGRYRMALERFLDWCGRRNEAGEASDADMMLLAALESALGRLSAEERTLIEGRYFNGESLVQMGERCGLSERAVEGRLARLRQRLREMIAEELKNL